MKNVFYSNIRKIYLGNFLNDMLFFVPVFVPFLAHLGFSMTQILIQEATFAICLVLLEVPSGYFADLYGRKRSMVWGAIFTFLSVVLLAFAYEFWHFVFAQIVNAIGMSFVSGAMEALTYDSLIDMKEEHRYKKVQGNIFFYQRCGAFFSNLLGGFLFFYGPRFPFYLAIIPYAIWLIIVLTLKEPKKHEVVHEKWEHFTKILKESFWHHEKLKSIILYSAVLTGFFLIGFWMYEKYMYEIKLPVIFFGVVIAVMNVFSGLFAKYAKELEEKITPRLSLIIVPLVAGVGWILISIMGNLGGILAFIGLIFTLVTCSMWGFSLPLFQDFVQKMVNSDRRATMLSLMSMLRRLVFFVFAPMVGVLVDLWGINFAFLIVAGIFPITILLLLKKNIF